MSGTIAVDGEVVVLASPSQAIARGLGMVHQHFQLADNLTVLENVVLRSEPSRRGSLDFAEARRKILEISDTYGLDIHPDCSSRNWVSVTGSGSRSSRCSIAAPVRSSSTSRPRCLCRRRSTNSSTRYAS